MRIAFALLFLSLVAYFTCIKIADYLRAQAIETYYDEHGQTSSDGGCGCG